MAVCDHEKKIHFASVRFVGSAHDARVFRVSALYRQHELFFQGNEYVLADAAYSAKSYILPALKKPHLQPYQPLDQQFNLLYSHARVKIEHCFGMLKGKFQSLRELRSTGVKNNACIMYLSVWIRCCFILHNLLLDDEQAYWEEKAKNKFRKNYGPRISPFVVDEERFFFFDNKDEGARIDIGLANSSSTRDYDASTFLESGRDKQARLREHDVLQSASFRRGLTLK